MLQVNPVCGTINNNTLIRGNISKALHRAYLAAVSYLDGKLGQVRQALEDFGLVDDTIIIFLSDHGDMLGHRGMVQKRTFYEHSTRIAMMIYFPKNFRYRLIIHLLKSAQ